jgi:hypothetical protein
MAAARVSIRVADRSARTTGPSLCVVVVRPRLLLLLQVEGSSCVVFEMCCDGYRGWLCVKMACVCRRNGYFLCVCLRRIALLPRLTFRMGQVCCVIGCKGRILTSADDLHLKQPRIPLAPENGFRLLFLKRNCSFVSSFLVSKQITRRHIPADNSNHSTRPAVPDMLLL